MMVFNDEVEKEAGEGHGTEGYEKRNRIAKAHMKNEK